MKKFLAIISFLLLIVFSTNVYAQSVVSLPEVPQLVSGELDVGAAISPMRKGNIAPFTGVLLSPKAVATLISEFNNLDAKIKVEVDKVKNENAVKFEFSKNEFTIRSEAEQKISLAQIQERDRRIQILNEQIKNDSGKKSNTPLWTGVGVSAGFILGILLTSFTVYAVNQSSK